MKTKNLILGLVAIVFAAGSAFTFKNEAMTQQAGVWVKHIDTNHPFVCVATSVNCDQISSQLCKVSVNLDIPGTVKSVTAHILPDCGSSITDDRIAAGSYSDPNGDLFDARN